MGFSPSLREDVLVRSGRRCCVCRRFKGVNIEVHHIKPEAEGGGDTIENAIALCFDCHSAAGHYNPKHPRGTRFSPSELKRHRDNLWADISGGLTVPAEPEISAGIHFRHLVCLNYELAKQVLSGGFKNEHFKLDRLLQTPVSAFMEAVLTDELPQEQNSLVRGGLATPGVVSVDSFWNTREELVADCPEFLNADERRVEARDLEQGPIRSRLLASCVKAGLSPSDLGSLAIQQAFCGGEGWYVEYKVRRPLFVFTVIENMGANTVTIAGVSGVSPDPGMSVFRPVAWPTSGGNPLQIPPITLLSGQSAVVPMAVILSPADEDDLAFEWIDNVFHGPGEITFTALSAEDARLGADAYLAVGPSFSVTSLEVVNADAAGTVTGRPFDILQVYLLGQGWLMGSCPHALVEREDGTLLYLGEILADALDDTRRQSVVIPRGASRLHICEFEFETTTISSVQVSGVDVLLDSVATLGQGEVLSIAINGDELVEITGKYGNVVGNPTTAVQRRFKRSLVAGGLRTFAAATHTRLC